MSGGRSVVVGRAEPLSPQGWTNWFGTKGPRQRLDWMVEAVIGHSVALGSALLPIMRLSSHTETGSSRLTASGPNEDG